MQSVWEKSKTIEQVDAMYKGVTIEALIHFKKVGKKLDLDPFSNEITIQKLDNGRCFVVIGRDGYRKIVKRSPHYDYHWVAPLFSNDSLKVIDGVPEHEKALNNKGSIVGAYGVLKRKDATRPYFWQVEYEEYSTGDDFWDEQHGKPATMIAKVCEVQLIRLGFQELFSNTYDEVELLKGSKKDEKKATIAFIQNHSDIAMDYIKDVGLLEMDEDELLEIVNKIKLKLQGNRRNDG